MILNLLWNRKRVIIVDAGDDAATQIVKSENAVIDVDTIILGHLQIDHTGGLSAIIGMRHQQDIPGTPTI